MNVDTTRILAKRVAPVIGLAGIALAVVTFRRGGAGQPPELLLGALGFIGIGAYFTFLRSGITLDREGRQVTVWWRWLALGGRRTVDVGADELVVERTIRRSKEQGAQNLFQIVLGESVLHTISEHQGGAEAAHDLAKRMAEHVGTRFGGQRDCPDMVRREALRQKYALAPLLIVLAAMLIGGILILGVR